jgi:hypothetical protein
VATLYRCDGCRDIFEDRDALEKIRLPYLKTYNDKFDEKGGYEREVCMKCARTLTNTFNSLKDKVNAPTNA